MVFRSRNGRKKKREKSTTREKTTSLAISCISCMCWLSPRRNPNSTYTRSKKKEEEKSTMIHSRGVSSRNPLPPSIRIRVGRQRLSPKKRREEGEGQGGSRPQRRFGLNGEEKRHIKFPASLQSYKSSLTSYPGLHFRNCKFRSSSHFLNTERWF